MFLVNPSGKIVGVSESKAEMLIKQGFRELTAEEAVTHQKLNQISNTNLPNGLPVRFLTSTDTPDGYGQSQSYLAKALIDNGIDIKKADAGQEIGLCYYTPVISDRLKTPIKAIYTMFESSTIPDEWLPKLKAADKVFVPSKFCQKIFATKGIETTVVPLGYNHDIYKYIERPENRKVFTFLHYNAYNMRKGFDLVFKAFTEEFKPDEPVRMIFKTVNKKSPIPFVKSEYPNIDVRHGEYSYSQMNALLKEADAFVFPSRGEGFGLTPLEALATGLPVIIPNGSGMSEYFDDQYFYEVKIKGTSPSMYQNYNPKDVGDMIEPDLKSLKKQMRYIYEHQVEAREVGKAGAKWVAQKWTVEQTGAKLASELKKLSKKVPVINDDTPDVAFLTEDISFYSGGRYHSWLQALMLADSKYRTVVYTNEYPVFTRDFDLYKQPEIKIIGKNEPDQNFAGARAFYKLDVKANAYFGSPATASLEAGRLAVKYKKPLYVTMFDPPSWVLKSPVCHANEIERDIRLKEFLHKHLDELPDFKLIVLTQNAVKPFADWYEIDEKYVVALHPAVNSRIINLFDKRTSRKRGNHIVTVSRNHPRKGFGDVLYAFKPYAHTYTLHIITSTEEGIATRIAELGIPQDRVVIHTKISDVEKYRIFAQSKALLSGSKFEGFGMWALEARAMGMPVVCYDLEALQDVYNDEGMYKAKCFDHDELRSLLGKALAAEPLIPKQDHDFEVIQNQLLKIIKPEQPTVPQDCTEDITPMFIVLNEEKYIGASLRAVCKRPEVKKVVVVEGADRRYPNASPDGLSIDNTAQEIEKVSAEYPDKIIYERMGWVNGKEELRNRCIQLSSQCGWGLFVDGDEVWSDYFWRKLAKQMRETRASVIYFKHLHFWKTPDQIAVGGQWDSPLFRCFRFVEKDLEVKMHANEPVTKNGTKIGDIYGRVVDDSIKVHHYGAMKNEQDIKDKLAFYKARDTKLDVKNTWSDWKEGQPTQWTHGGGGVENYTGKHPEEVTNIIMQ